MTDRYERNVYSPSLCITHRCNLNCTYCYQKHDDQTMNFGTAKEVLEKIFSSVPKDSTEVHIGFIGGEPLVEFELIKQICEYSWKIKRNILYLFFATTNGTLLDADMKKWLRANRRRFLLGLSLDGNKDSHDQNRSNSFDRIDIPFFIKNYPTEGVKMTVSEYSLRHLAENIKYIHSLGIKDIHGANLAEGDFDWENPELIKITAQQLKELVDFYAEKTNLPECQLLNKNLAFCEQKTISKQKYCGIGGGANFFDIDGKEYPCPYCTPMTFSQEQLEEIKSTDYSNDENFIDADCYENCYLFPICPSCAGNNFKQTGSFKKHERSKCQIAKLTALFIAELQARKIVKNASGMDDNTKYWTIEAIKKIKSLYLKEFENFLN